MKSILTEEGVLKEDNNALIIDFKQYGAKNLEITIVRNRQGTSTYLLRDIAAVLEREEKYSFDKMIYVISSEQDIYMKRLFKVIELMGYTTLSPIPTGLQTVPANRKPNIQANGAIPRRDSQRIQNSRTNHHPNLPLQNQPPGLLRLRGHQGN